MKIIVFTTLMVVVIATIQLTQTEVEGAALDQIKDAAKSIGKAAAEKADSVTEVPQTGGVVQTVLHKTASMALDKGVDILAAKYPIVGAAAPHIKKFSKPMLNAAHNKINSMYDKSETTTVSPTEPAKEGAAKDEKAKDAAANADDKKDDDDKKPGLMDKIKSMVGADDKEEEKPKENEVEQKGDVKGKKNKANKKKKPAKKSKNAGANKGQEGDEPAATDDNDDAKIESKNEADADTKGSKTAEQKE